MKHLMVCMSFLMCISIYAQDTLSLATENPDSGVKVILNPDLMILFPDSAIKTSDDGIDLYRLEMNNQVYEISSEQSPLDYTGRYTAEVDQEYYGPLTEKVLNEGPDRTLISERDFKLDGFNVREIIYSDASNEKTSRVTLWILNVIGFRPACYKIRFTDYDNSMHLPPTAEAFFASIDIYYLMENNISLDEEKADQLLKDEGFKIAKEKIKLKKRKRKK